MSKFSEKIFASVFGSWNFLAFLRGFVLLVFVNFILLVVLREGGLVDLI